MNLFLEQVSQTFSKYFIVMQVDQAGWHSAKDLVIPENIRLIPQPAYSPELNPVEHIWDELREKYFHNRVFSSLDRLIDVLCVLHIVASEVLAGALDIARQQREHVRIVIGIDRLREIDQRHGSLPVKDVVCRKVAMNATMRQRQFDVVEDAVEQRLRLLLLKHNIA